MGVNKKASNETALRSTEVNEANDIIRGARGSDSNWKMKLSELRTYANVNARTYKVYVALIQQTGSDAPVVTVLENTIGNIAWARNSTGAYGAVLSGAFPTERTFMNIENDDAANYITGIDMDAFQPNQFVVLTTSLSGTALDSVLNNCSLEIRVYPPLP